MNLCILSGRLTHDPETRFLQNGTAMTKFALAVEHRYEQNGEWKAKTAFIDCILWGKRGDFFCKYHHKGSVATVEGRLDQESWEDKQAGARRSKISVVVNDFVLPPRDKNQEPAEAPPTTAEVPFGP